MSVISYQRVFVKKWEPSGLAQYEPALTISDAVVSVV